MTPSLRALMGLFVVSCLLAACGTGPRLVVPTAKAEEYSAMQLAAVHAVSDDEIWLCGNLTRSSEVEGAGASEGLLFVTSDRGRSWRRTAYASIDARDTSFTTLFFVDRLRGFVAGTRLDEAGRLVPVLWRTRDGGNRWSEVRILHGGTNPILRLRDLIFTTDRQGAFVVEEFDAASNATLQTTYVTLDGGNSWEARAYQTEQSAGRDPSVSWFDRANRRGFLYRELHPNESYSVEGTTNGGASWAQIATLRVADLDQHWGQSSPR